MGNDGFDSVTETCSCGESITYPALLSVGQVQWKLKHAGCSRDPEPSGLLAEFLRKLHQLEAALGEDDRMIRVWRFHEAPELLQRLSRNGGDEDWVLVCPDGREPLWADAGSSSFGVCDVERHELPGGTVVLIGCHS